MQRIFLVIRNRHPAAFPLVRRRGQNLDGFMPSRSRLQFTLVLVVLVALCVFVPGMLYFTELALRELRFLWWLVLLIGGLIWLLAHLRRKK
jgi:hypothetical protein